MTYTRKRGEGERILRIAFSHSLVVLCCLLLPSRGASARWPIFSPVLCLAREQLSLSLSLASPLYHTTCMYARTHAYARLTVYTLCVCVARMGSFLNFGRKLISFCVVANLFFIGLARLCSLYHDPTTRDAILVNCFIFCISLVFG